MIALFDQNCIVTAIVDKPPKGYLGDFGDTADYTSCIIGQRRGELRSVANERHALNLAKINAAAITDDRTATQVQSLLPEMKYKGALIKGGSYIQWADQTYKAAKDLWDTERNNPDNAPNLWVKIMYHEGYRIIPEVISAAEAFAKDEVGYWTDGQYYQAVRDGVVHTPAGYPADWIPYVL